MSITIDKRPSGKYRAQVRISGYPSQSKSFPRRAQAVAWADSLHRDLLDQQVDPTALSKRRTLLHGIDLYLEEAVPHKKSAATITNRLLTWRKRIGAVRLIDLTPEMIESELRRMTCSGATKNRYLSDLSGCLTYLSKTPYCWISNNPARLVRRLPDSKRRERVITPQEWHALLSAAETIAKSESIQNQQLPFYLRVLYASGMRRSEALNMLWADLDQSTGMVLLRDTKNGTSRRSCIGADLAQAIATLPRRDDDQYVFTGRYPDQPTSFDVLFRKARDLAGITVDDKGEQLTQHSLRHSVATEAGKAGANLVELQALTGHKSLRVLQDYLHADDQALLAALNKRGGKV